MIAPPVVIGHSIHGRPIVAQRIGAVDAPHRLLVVGSVHGTEPGGIRVARALRNAMPPEGTQVWVVDDLNPDGHVAGTRGNARGVDLNRNFPFRWRPSTAEWDPGRHRLSEPEARAGFRLISQVRPDITIWFHQAATQVDLSGGDPSVEWRYGHRVGLRVARMRRYPGSASGWQDHAFPGNTAFVVELGPGPPSRAVVRRHVDAVLAAAADLVPATPAPTPVPDPAPPADPAAPAG